MTPTVAILSGRSNRDDIKLITNLGVSGVMAHEPGALVGVEAPAFTLNDPQVEPVSLSDLLGSGPVVLFFVPRPTTGVCMKTACGLRDTYSRLQDAGARAVGISPMSPRTHARLQKEHAFQFVYLSDRDQSVARKYGVNPFLGFIPGRATFVLDSQGIVRWKETNPLMASSHVEGAARAVQRLAAEDPAEAVT